ncbi:MAG: DJ-1/PfpI family protein [Chthoniobacterales bacterium]
MSLPGDQTPKRVGLLGFDGVAALDLTGPLEALKLARFPGDQGADSRCYETLVVGLKSKCFTSDSGLVFRANAMTDLAPPFDTILVPGGKGLRQPETTRLAADWLCARVGSTRRIASVSTGIYALAESASASAKIDHHATLPYFSDSL